MKQITWRNITRNEYIRLMEGANNTIADFMTYNSDPVAMRGTYRKINHIKMLKNMMGTDLKTAKEVIDMAIVLWDNEHPEARTTEASLDALRSKLTGVTKDTSWALDNESPF